MHSAIRTERLSKRYLLGRRPEGYKTLRESLSSALGDRWKRFSSLKFSDHGASQEFWALSDVSFDIQRGEVTGIIGRNGAGKSTLLKILSRITEPTSGRVEIRGRIASLLEVGTGFHPELTGRENIFLNGSILGMQRREIRRRFDEIVGFSGIDAFLDTPIKRYSSGMYIRLAFAVAAHLEPEILIVDEVLAVGDLAFQQMCLGKMRDVASSGRTVLFVSHNMPAIESLCSRGILMQQGRICEDGPINQIVKHYRDQALDTQVANSVESSGDAFFKSVVLLDEYGEPTTIVAIGRGIRLRIGVHSATPLRSPRIGIGIDDYLGNRLLSAHTPRSKDAIGEIVDDCSIECTIHSLPLAPGNYTLTLGCALNGELLGNVERAFSFTVVDGELFDEGQGFHRGICIARSSWRRTGDPALG